MSEIRKYLKTLGLDPARVLATTWDAESYYEIRMDWKTNQPAVGADGTILTRRKKWPDGFSEEDLRNAIAEDGYAKDR